jgi:hypothetical protein
VREQCVEPHRQCAQPLPDELQRLDLQARVLDGLGLAGLLRDLIPAPVVHDGFPIFCYELDREAFSAKKFGRGWIVEHTALGLQQ